MSQKFRTRGELEAEVTQCVLRTLKEVLGRGPEDARTFLCESMLVVRCKVPLQPPERALLHDVNPANLSLVRDWRRRLYETCTDQIRDNVSKIVGVEIRAVYADSSPLHEETMIAFSLSKKPEYRVAGEAGDPEKDGKPAQSP